MAIKISGSTIIDDSRNIVSGAAATFTGNVTIQGTLTYEDVTNIDSVGIVTAGQGVRITAGGLNVVGVSTLGILTATSIKSPKFDGDADKNVVMGCSAGIAITDTITTGIKNVLIGACAGKSVQKCFNVFIGDNAGCCAESGSGNPGNGAHVFIGAGAGQCQGKYGLTGSYNNTFVGAGAGCRQTCSNANIALGNAAGRGATGCKGGSCNIAIGFRSNCEVKSLNNNNIALGRLTGMSNSTGCSNIWIGNTAGFYQIGGSGNIVMGQGARRNPTQGSHNIVFGCYASCAANSES